MAREILLRSQESTYGIKYTHVEIALLHRMPPEYLKLLSDLMDPKRLKRLNQDGILSILDRIHRHIVDNIENYYYYGYKYISGHCADDAVCDGCTSGLVLIGDPSLAFHEIEGGVSSCSMRPVLRDKPDVAEIELGEGQVLKTNIGDILIVRTPPFALLGKLDGAIQYLKSHDIINKSSF